MKRTISIPKLKKKALDLYSELVKRRAASEGKLRCYTCDAPLVLKTSNCHLGHYLSRGAYPGLTFHPNNSRVQCYRCNCHLHGATVEFRERLIIEIGHFKVTQMEYLRHRPVKWSRSDLLQMIEDFNSELNELR